MGSPVVGICAALERGRWGVWEETVTLAPRSYATAVQRAGGHRGRCCRPTPRPRPIQTGCWSCSTR